MLTRLFGPVYFDPSILTRLFGTIYLDPSIWTRLFRPVYLDPSASTYQFGPIILTRQFGPVYWDPSSQKLYQSQWKGEFWVVVELHRGGSATMGANLSCLVLFCPEKPVKNVFNIRIISLVQHIHNICCDGEREYNWNV